MEIRFAEQEKIGLDEVGIYIYRLFVDVRLTAEQSVGRA